MGIVGVRGCACEVPALGLVLGAALVEQDLWDEEVGVRVYRMRLSGKHLYRIRRGCRSSTKTLSNRGAM